MAAARASRLLAAVLLAFLAPREGAGQPGLQVWGNLTFDWVTSDRVTYEVDFEPKALVVETTEQMVNFRVKRFF